MLRQTLFLLILILIACILSFTLNILDSAESNGEKAKEIADISEKPSIVTLASTMKSFRNTLSEELLTDASFPLGHKESYSWSNLPPSNNFDRGGIGFSELSTDQLILFHEVLKVFLSDEGYTKILLITQKSKTPIGEINPNFWNSRPYYIALFGNPETDGSWGFQLDGHHLGLNLLVHGDEVSIVPTHLGTSPTIFDGEIVLEGERTNALTLLDSLDSEQKEKTIQTDGRRGLKVGPGSTTDPYLDYDYSDFVGIGLKASEMNDEQKENLRKLIKSYVYNLESEFADIWMKDIDEGINDTYFVWIGGTTDKDSIYYRVFNPAVWIEFNDEGRSGGSPNHIHTIVRSPNGNDYGIFALNRVPKTLWEHYTLADHENDKESFDNIISE